MDLHVVGDSLSAGYGLDDPTGSAWPARLPEHASGLAREDVTVDASTGRTLRDCADRLGTDALAERFESGDADAAADRVVLVQAGHNDAQLSGGDPRVTETDFRETAAALDARLAGAAAIDRHAFLGMVPLLPLDRPGTIPFGDEQPDRGLAYDDLLAGTVGVHLRVVAGDADATGGDGVDTDATDADRHGVGTDAALSRPDDWREWTTDGVHPGPAGHDVLARRVAGWLTG
jgi:lysophospholipase L1-like esterase